MSREITGILSAFGATMSTVVFIFIVAFVVLLGRKMPR
jgi:hypothetical protein